MHLLRQIFHSGLDNDTAWRKPMNLPKAQLRNQNIISQSPTTKRVPKLCFCEHYCLHMHKHNMQMDMVSAATQSSAHARDDSCSCKHHCTHACMHTHANTYKHPHALNVMMLSFILWMHVTTYACEHNCTWCCRRGAQWQSRIANSSSR
jgi:hypothetical protein